uniref:Uncharacterized protein n=1 Tax=Romanomermis culicivorax TaxID=13658 RepID=A0A915KQM3_ROMCU
MTYQPKYTPGYDPPFLENILLSDQPGIQIMHSGDKVIIMLIGKQPVAPVKGAKKADDDEGQPFNIPILMERQPRDMSRSRSQHLRHSSHSQSRQQPGVFKLLFANQESQGPEKDEDVKFYTGHYASQKFQDASQKFQDASQNIKM